MINILNACQNKGCRNDINELNYFAYAQIKIGFVFQNKGKPCFYEKKQER